MSGLCCGVYCQPVVWLSLPIAPGIVAKTQTARWWSPPTFMHCRQMMKLAGKLWWLSCSPMDYRWWPERVCVLWWSFPWLRKDIDAMYVPGLFGQAWISNNTVPDWCIGRCSTLSHASRPRSSKHFVTQSFQTVARNNDKYIEGEQKI
jgi:hypothetical protein